MAPHYMQQITEGCRKYLRIGLWASLQCTAIYRVESWVQGVISRSWCPFQKETNSDNDVKGSHTTAKPAGHNGYCSHDVGEEQNSSFLHVSHTRLDHVAVCIIQQAKAVLTCLLHRLNQQHNLQFNQPPNRMVPQYHMTWCPRQSWRRTRGLTATNQVPNLIKNDHPRWRKPLAKMVAKPQRIQHLLPKPPTVATQHCYPTKYWTTSRSCR